MDIFRKKLTEQFEINALWDLERMNNTNAIGTLIYSQDEIILKLPNISLDINEKYDYIVGKTMSKFISLFNLRVIKNYESDLIYTELLVEQMSIDSKSYTNLNDLKISSIEFSFNKLPLLFNSNIWKKDDEKDIIYKDPIQTKSHTIDYINASLIDKYEREESSRFTNDLGLVINLKTIPHLELKYSEGKNILEIKEDILKLRNLFTILSGVSMTISYLKYKSEDRDLIGCKIPDYGSLYFNQIEVDRKTHQIHSSYNYDEITIDFSQILDNYYRYYEKLKPIIQNLYIHRTVRSLLETAFTDSITSLEVYHREFYHEYKEMNPKLDETKQKIINIIESNHKKENELDELKRIVKEINKVTLKNRVKTLLLDLPDNLKEKLLFEGCNFTINSQVNDFSYKCSKTRNYYAHGSTGTRNNIFESRNLVYVIKILNLVSEYYLMKTIGVCDKTIIKAIEHNIIYQSVLKNYDFKKL